MQQRLVPLAFSAYSQHPLDDAIRFPLLSEQEVDLHHVLQTGAEHVWDAGLTCEAILTCGTPFQRIMEMVENRHNDLMVMGAHRHRGSRALSRGAC
jgi:nucleotide-binding universal stress UspA family protein